MCSCFEYKLVYTRVTRRNGCPVFVLSQSDKASIFYNVGVKKEYIFY